MKVDLDELERLARAATGATWDVGPVPGMPRHDEPIMAVVLSDKLDAGDRVQQIADCYDNTRCADSQCKANAQHIAANSPAVTLALIERIRELEATVGACGNAFAGMSEAPRAIDMIALLKKGVVLP